MSLLRSSRNVRRSSREYRFFGLASVLISDFFEGIVDLHVVLELLSIIRSVHFGNMLVYRLAYVGLQLAIKAPPHRDAFCSYTNDMVDREGTSPSNQITIIPVYGVKERALLPLLENVIGPAGVRLILNIDLMITEIGL